MTELSRENPIGIFDSGIGGLTVTHAIVRQLPKENIIYFGDTAHLPYGDKSKTSIQAYSIKIANMLLEQQCKMILIACNSASAAAFDLVREYVADKAIVLNVIDPLIQHVCRNHANKKLGLIGTRQTVNSEVYSKKLTKQQCNVQLNSLATNLLASAIEEFGDTNVIDGLLQEYLSHPNLQNVEGLILACTHYPVVKERISAYFQHKVDIIDPSDIVAASVKAQLENANLLNIEGSGLKQFYVSDYTESFVANTKIFFGEAIHLKHYPLW